MALRGAAPCAACYERLTEDPASLIMVLSFSEEEATQLYSRFVPSRAIAIAAVGLVASLSASATISYSCDPTVDAAQAGTCAFVNSTTAGVYNSTFTNVNASIYIKMGTTGLGESTTGFFNTMSYSAYLTALTAHASSDLVDVSAIAALNATDTAVYGSDNVVITSALGVALGLTPSSLTGTTAAGSSCAIGTAGCYNGIITITTAANLFSESGGTQFLYWNQNGGMQPADAYDFYSIVEHETDEILGTASCITTQTNPLSNSCSGFGAATPSAVDLFRYSAPSTLVNLHNSLSATPGQYFSYNSGATNGANGKAYHTLDDSQDYADFESSCAEVQDATGCLGSDLDIANDGNAEINILDAIGYNTHQGPVPEPGTIALMALGLVGLVAYRRQRGL